MAVDTSPNSKASSENTKKMNSSSGKTVETKSEMKPANSSSQLKKRNNNPGVRVIQSGTTCHQCRHKLYGVYARCKNQTNTKLCPIKYCRACLLNRYGEKVEDVVVLEKWDCPKCKGVCNCSICMKKRGHQPTGMVTRMAKAGRFSSVLEMIVEKGAQNVINYKRVKETTASSTEGIKITSPKKSEKKKLVDSKTDSNANPQVSVSSTANEKTNKLKRKGFEVNDENNQKKLKSKEIVGGDEINGLISKVNGGQLPVKEHIIRDQNATQYFGAVNPLSTGTELVTIAGVDLPKEDVGNALQFLEFSATFGDTLNVKKGQAETVLKELIKGRSTRRGKFTSVIQFQIQLLSVIQQLSESESKSESESESDSPTFLTHDNDSWLKDLKSCISNSELKHIDFIDMTAGRYDNLDSSTKLKILVFLCDEVLGTEKVRNWIDDQNDKLFEKRKEGKDKLSVAKDKEKNLKQKMQDEIAEAIIAKDGVPLTIKEHDAIVSKMKEKAAEAHAEMLACKNMVNIDIETPDAVRTEPIFSDNNGHVYWRLKGCFDKSFILQDIGTGDHTVESADKWFEFDDEHMDLIEKHINVLRSRFRKCYKNGK